MQNKHKTTHRDGNGDVAEISHCAAKAYLGLHAHVNTCNTVPAQHYQPKTGNVVPL